VHGKVTVGDYLFPMGGIGLPLGALHDHIPSPIDIAQYSGIQFWVKGDGKRYMLRVADDDVRDYNFHHHPFTTTPDWQLVRLRFADLKQFDWGQHVAWTGRNVSAFLFTNYSPPGEDFGDFELYLDEISLF
jgi:complex I intermediate-associated protein 30 (CIA30)